MGRVCLNTSPLSLTQVRVPMRQKTEAQEMVRTLPDTALQTCSPAGMRSSPHQRRAPNTSIYLYLGPKLGNGLSL